MASSRKILTVLATILVIDLTSFTCILPLFPSIFDSYANNAKLANENENADPFFTYFDATVKSLQRILGIPDEHRYNNVFFAGILGSMFSILQYLSSPIFGALSDVFGRKPLLLISISGSLISYYLWLYAEKSFGLFIASRAVGGLSKASVSIAIAVVADVLPANVRGRGMAIVGMTFSIAFIVGPVIGAYFASNGFKKTEIITTMTTVNDAPARFSIYATIIELIMIIVLLPETLKKPKVKFSQILSFAWDYILPWRVFNFHALKRSEGNRLSSSSLISIQSCARLYFVYLFLYSALEFTLCFLTHRRFAYDSSRQGRLYLYSGLLMIFVQGGYIRRIPMEQQKNALRLGLIVIVPAFVLIGIAFNEFILYAGLGLYAIASAVVVPCLNTIIASQCDEALKGTCLGVFRSVGALARALGPLVGSFLFWLLGATYNYLLGATLLILPIYMLKKIDGLNSVSINKKYE